jgi:hypothetical protein
MAEILPNPWTEASAFDRFTIAGFTFTGAVDFDASNLLKKKSDHRRSRGRNGGRTVNTGWDLVTFSVTLSAWDEATLQQLQEVLRRVGRGAVATQDTTALGVAHPYLAAVGITQATLESAGFVPVQAGGRLGLKLSLKEYRPPAPTQAPGARSPDPEPQQVEDGSAERATGNRGLEQIVSRSRPVPLAPRAPKAPSSDP